jgi:hypothetical protein
MAMSNTTALAQRVCEQAQSLPEDSLVELAKYIEYLRFKAEKPRLLQEQLARDYEELALLYDELAAELTDEVWLPLENEALLRSEKDLGS